MNIQKIRNELLKLENPNLFTDADWKHLEVLLLTEVYGFTNLGDGRFQDPWGPETYNYDQLPCPLRSLDNALDLVFYAGYTLYGYNINVPLGKKAWKRCSAKLRISKIGIIDGYGSTGPIAIVKVLTGQLLWRKERNLDV